ncbi:hypothetical protein UFOVP821_21 [uncultured Caudovirales phage]|uniref:Uncharacterized protein n=1 Tax=uncultured Caudovirales phage TaxID=2100421 RepID=A0A6J5P1Z2_9CAUD|nr:hypothetical protein UFOVP821_21 [uncultured Caudovirales phage]
MYKAAAIYIGQLTAKQRKRLVKLAKTDDNHLSNIKAGARIGIDLASRIENAAHQLFGEDVDAPPPILRQEMCDVCRRCPNAR